ncbi:MAG: hypothetical protein FJ224_05440 [Lentisphaerae bacterium]|nr:hypothetical protein [Lentisphaerota bacterium]
MASKSDENLSSAIRLADEMNSLANDGDEYSQDDGCCVLYGIVRDCAFKIRLRALQELERHRTKKRTNGQRV